MTYALLVGDTGFPFDHNYTCRRVKWGENGIGPVQHSLTTETPFKSPKMVFKAKALGSNLIHRRLSTSQLPILDPPSPVHAVHDLLHVSPVLPPLMGSPPPPRASRGSAIHVFLAYGKAGIH